MSLSRAERRNEKRIRNVRISFAVYIALLAVLCVNMFLVVDKSLMIYEQVLTGLAYFFNLRLVLRNMNTGRSGEMTFYFLVHVIIGVGVVFLLIADQISSNTVPTRIDALD